MTTTLADNIKFWLLMTVLIAALWGWVWNIVKTVGMLSDPSLTPMFIGRAVGIPFVPLGALLGWF